MVQLENRNPHIIRIFDSSTYPTLDGTWYGSHRGETFVDLAESIKSYPNYRVLAHGLPNIGKYSHVMYKKKCDEFGFEAIAALTTIDFRAITNEIEAIAELGYRGIEVHPRLLGANRTLDFLTEIFQACVATNLTCLLCTYEATPPGNLPIRDPFYDICGALNSAPHVKLILMHGGASRLLQFAALARHSATILLDLSFTFMDGLHRGMSDDIHALLIELDQRICIGSDSPENSISDFIERLTSALEGLPPAKAFNIACGNLCRFFPEH